MADSQHSQRHSRPPIITLLTDFGLADVYVGVMKGVISTIQPHAHIIDLTHQIPPQNIAIGSFQLGNAYAHFPVNTIYVGVVDPGVGSTRRAVAIQTNSGILVGPDNGLFSHVLQQAEVHLAVELSNRNYWYLEEPSNTFHGRDIFAPVAAYLSQGVSLQALGDPILSSSLITLPEFNAWQPTDQGGVGILQSIDYFGNLITNISGNNVKNHSWSLKIGQYKINSAISYSETVDNPGLHALIGSHGWIEIALFQGNAQQLLQAKLGDPVQLYLSLADHHPL